MEANINKEASAEQLFSLFIGDLWIKRRLDLDVVVKHLEEARGFHNEVISIDQWIKFIKFLDTYCSGKQFTDDKQWSELMNHMHISRRLNHKSVKFRDILQNYDAINSNQRQIKRLNEIANLIRLVEGLINSLDKLLSKGQLSLTSKIYIVDELSSSRTYLRDQCQPLLGALRTELSNDILADHPKLDNWSQLTDEYDFNLRKLDTFFSLLLSFQGKLMQLGQLLETEDKIEIQDSHSNLISSAIDTCKGKFKAAYKFNKNLVKSLAERSHGKGVNFLKIISLDTNYNYSETIIETHSTLEECDAKLTQLMRELRIEFGRFYFVSDQELLKIISLNTKLVTSQDSSSRRIISKLFNDSFDTYQMDDFAKELVGVKNAMGEVVQFLDGPILLKKRVKVYSLEIVRILNETLRKLNTSLRLYLSKCFSTSKIELPPADLELPFQVILLKYQIQFSDLIQAVVNGKGDLKSLRESYELKLKELSTKHISDSPERSELDNYKSSSIISFVIHFLRVIRSLQSLPNELEIGRYLMRQLLFQFDTLSSTLTVKIGTSTFEYGFEYLPLSIDPSSNHTQKHQSFKRLINTKTNELSFLVASAAVSNFKLGANPYGPAGSGKTETIKALGHLLGYQVVVHNCDETNESESLDRIISGLAQTGLWGCFDEFNRLSHSTLSAFSTRLELIQGAIREGKNTLETDEGQFMRINPSTAFFVTLNPGGDNTRYKGRRKLPANLRHLFLPIAMTQVEVDIIFAEMLLTSSGQLGGAHLEIDEAQELGDCTKRWLASMRSKSVGLGRCEWDLRLIMAILKRLGTLLKFNIEHGNNSGELDWKSLLVESIRIELHPRLTKAERKLLDLELEVIFNISATNLNPSSPLAPEEYLKTQLETHVGVLLVGPTTSGKSKCWRQLYQIHETTTRWLALNPKSCHNLLGDIDPATERWTDGLFTTLVRKAQGMLLDEKSSVSQVWIVLDGPIDSDWIESLNSVLDDNLVLTLVSGERLRFVFGHKCIKLIFEVTDISLASPATISRLGLVLFEEKSTQLVPQFSSLEDFLHNEYNLCILAGSNVRARNSLLSSHYQSKYIQYNCSRYTTSRELIDLVRDYQTTSNILILSNVHLIESDDKYGNRTFFEMLRFILVYKGFYDSNNNFKSLQTRFIVTLDDVNQLNDRCASLAQITHIMDDDKVKEVDSDIKLRFEEFIRNDLFGCKEFNEPIMTFVMVPPHLDICKQISSRFPNCDIYTFRSKVEIHKSIEYLENLTSKPVLTYRKESVIIMSRIESNLMSKDDKRKLHYLLNKFKQVSKGVKFIYYEDCTKKLLDTFWFSMGPVYEHDKLVPSREKLKSYIDDRFKNIVANVSSSCKNWLIKKTVDHIDSVSDEFYDQEYLETYLEQLTKCIVSTINEATHDLEQKQQILQPGLEQLENFNQLVESLKGSCESQEEEMKDRKCQVEKLMSSLKISIETAGNQRDNLKLLKQEHHERTIDIKAKSSSIENDLKQVADMLEDSKVEVEKYLKPDALNEIKSLREPPKTIMDILEVLFLLLGAKDLSWTSIKSNLARGSLRDELTCYDTKRRLNAVLLNKVEMMMREKKSSFSMESASRASKAAVPIIGWIKATLGYGKMLVKLQPMTSEMDKLSLELSNINQNATKLEKELASLESNIKDDNEELERLNQKYIKSQTATGLIKSKLAKVEEIAQSLVAQKSSWEEKLLKLNSILNEGVLSKLCLATSMLVVEKPWTQVGGEFMEELDHLLEYCELVHQVKQEQSREKRRKNFIEKAANLFLSAKSLDEFVLKDGEEVQITLFLVVMKVCLLINVVPFIDIDNLEEKAVELKLLKTLGMKQVLCTSSNTIAFCKMDPGTSTLSDSKSSWSQTVDLNIRLGRLTCLSLLSNESMDLELANIIRTTTGKTALGDTSNNRNTIILAGKLAEHPQIRRLVRAVKSPVASNHSIVEIQSMLLEYLVSSYNPTLNQSIRLHEQQLERKQAEVQDLEWRLVDKLATSTRNRTITGSKAIPAELEIDGDLVDILTELQQLSRKLAIDFSQLSVGLGELKSKQTEYIKLALEAEKFYTEFLQEMSNIDPFYRLPLDKYCSLVLNSLKGSCTQELDYSYIASKYARRLRANDRQVFVNHLKEKQLIESSFEAEKLASQLEKSFLETIHEIQESSGHCVQLMLVAHESTESSPQLEIDEIVQRYNKNSLGILRYSKMNATNNKVGCERLMQTIELALKTNQKRGSHDRVECVCIGNAHLVEGWLDSWLVELLQSGKDDCKVLILLIAEATGESLEFSSSLHGFGGSLLGFAQVKHWYVESGLSLPERFKLFMARLLLSQPTAITGGNKLEASIRRLVLLHVVCQERSRRCLDLSARGKEENQKEEEEELDSWLMPYVFDYNQLRLASKSLHWLIMSKKQPPDWEELFCHHLRDIIYGPRLETLKDQQAMAQLVDKFILAPSDSPAPNQVVDHLEASLVKDKSHGQHLATYDKCLSKLLSTSHSLQEQVIWCDR